MTKMIEIMVHGTSFNNEWSYTIESDIKGPKGKVTLFPRKKTNKIPKNIWWETKDLEIKPWILY